MTRFWYYTDLLMLKYGQQKIDYTNQLCLIVTVFVDSSFSQTEDIWFHTPKVLSSTRTRAVDVCVLCVPRDCRIKTELTRCFCPHPAPR